MPGMRRGASRFSGLSDYINLIVFALRNLFKFHCEEVSLKVKTGVRIRNVCGIQDGAGGIFQDNGLALGKVEDGLPFGCRIGVGVVAVDDNAVSGLDHVAVLERIVVGAVGKDIAF